MRGEDVKACFAGAAVGFVDLVSQVAPADWTRPALGEWDVLGLVGHTGRALSTVEAYLGRTGEGPVLEGPVAYFHEVMTDGTAHAERRRQQDLAVAERGREAGASLGDDPAASIAALAGRVVALVADAADDTPVSPRPGTMTLVGYLPTRSFELAVHSLDLARALDLDVPGALRPAIAASCRLAGCLAAEHPAAADILLLLTGRQKLSGSLSVL